VESSSTYDYHRVIEDDERATELRNLALKHQQIKEQLNAIRAANAPPVDFQPKMQQTSISTDSSEMEFREMEEMDMISGS